MATIEFKVNDKGNGGFYLEEDGKKLGEMVIHVGSDHLTVYHTEVAAEAEGKGFAKQLLDAMVAYAREHGLKVIPLCAYVHAQFQRHPDLYADLWKKD